MMLSGTSRRGHDAVQAVWSSLLPTSVLPESHTEDEEVMKLSLLLKSMHILVSGLRDKQLSTAAQLQSTADDLKLEKVKREQFELETKTLRKDLAMVKFELRSTEASMKKFEADLGAANAQCERLKSKIESEVEVRLRKMFTNCLQQNKAATVQEMMTQMYQDTQVPAADGKNLAAELPCKRFQASGLPDEKQTKRAKMSSKNIKLDEASPDSSLILATPESRKMQAMAKKNLLHGRKGVLKPKATPNSVNSAPSSPDVIAGTPSPIILKKDIRKIDKKRSFFNSDVIESDIVDEPEKNSIVYAKDTQDYDEVTPEASRPALKENIVVPPTLVPQSYEEENVTTHSAEKDKENEISSPECNNRHRRSIADLSTDVEFPSSPKKSSESREGSPILGNSGSKKSSSRLPCNMSSGYVSSLSSKTSRPLHSSFQALNMAEVSIRKTASGKSRTQYQPTIRSSFAIINKSKLNNSKLNSSKSNKSRLTLNKDRQFITGLSMDGPYLNEEQVKMAIEENDQEGALDDSDITMFIPNSKCPGRAESVQETSNHSRNLNPLMGGKHEKTAPPEEFFEPAFASTAKEEVTPAKQKCPTNSLGSNILPLSLRAPSASQFKPPFASTEKELSENSALHDLTKLLDAEALDDTAAYPPDTSYDRVPDKFIDPGYKYQGKQGRKKHERKNLPAVECSQCGQYFAAAFGSGGEEVKKMIVHSCSRHRDRNGPRPTTPPKYWDPGWTSPAVVQKHEEETG